MDIYLKLSAIDPLTGFQAATDFVRFSDIMDEASVASIASRLYQQYLPRTKNADTMAEIAFTAMSDKK